METTDVGISLDAPRIKDWYYGKWVCAYCLGQCSISSSGDRKSTDTVTVFVEFPIIDNDHVLIPRGLHKFHKDCLELFNLGAKREGR